MKKGTKAYSILKSKCPHCHEGDFFEGSFFKAHVKERCDVCNKRFSKEPGFYQGSYYVVYALMVAIFVTIWVSIELFFSSISFDATLIAIVSGLILSAPFTYPLSKTIWANFFFHYQPDEKEKITKIDT